ncbi:MAG: ABC transporter substrate-binding protein [Prevotellaceae bacterium]|jgi:peptide/nickel transport system substrate-binding protein|nr:ABC transporter substrate-binding protein [Prevotellaceae bacterium]
MNIRISIIFLLLLLASCSSKKTEFSSVFRYNESKGIPTLDPAFARTQAIINPCMQLFNGLLQLDDELNVVPCIAEKYDLSADGVTYTFTLRSDVFFHNHQVFPGGVGRKVLADDFVYTFYRLVDPKLASPGSWTLSNMDTCYAMGKNRLVVKLKQPSPVFLSTLTMPYCFVVPKEVVDLYGVEFGKRPIGTGPFYLKAWREGEKLVMRRNRKYFEKDNGGNQLPYLEAVAITFVPDKQSEFLEFSKGKISYLSGIHAASRDELLTHKGELNPKYEDRIQMLQGSYLNTEYLGFLLSENSEFTNSALQSVNVRRAIAHGIDKKKMVEFLRSNLAYPANNGFVPMGLPSFSEELFGFEYSPQKAMALLSKAGFPNGNGLPEITLSTTDDYLDICEYIQYSLSQMGVRIKINVLSGAAYRQQVAEGKLAMFRASWIADYPDAESYLSLLYSKNASPNGPNYTHFSSENYDKLYEQSLKETDIKKRYELYRKMDSIGIAEASIVPLFYDKATRFVQKGIAGMEPNAMNVLILKNVSVGK